MSIHHKSDAEFIATTHNAARFFTEHRQIAAVLLMAIFVWGWYGYHHMPKRKDPDIPVRVAAAQCNWPGATAEQVEQLVTRPMEQATAQNSTIHPHSPSNFGIRSISFPGLAVVYVQLDDNVNDKQKEFSDINLKLNQLNPQLPHGAGPIQFNSNFGDTAALMLTVASPMVDADRSRPARASPSATPSSRRAPRCRDAPQPRHERHLLLSHVSLARAGASVASRSQSRRCRSNGASAATFISSKGPDLLGLTSIPLSTRKAFARCGDRLIDDASSPLRAASRCMATQPSLAIPPRPRPS